MVEPGLSLSNEALVILNSQHLSFLTCKIELILNSFSYSEDETKKNNLQRLAPSLSWVARGVRGRKCLWILVGLGVFQEGCARLVGSAEQQGLRLTPTWGCCTERHLFLSSKRFLGISFTDQEVRKKLGYFPESESGMLAADGSQLFSNLIFRNILSPFSSESLVPALVALLMNSAGYWEVISSFLLP